MADVSQGMACPNDGTLTACSGDFDSDTLVGVCAYCGQNVTMPHHRVERVAVGEHPVAAPTFVQVTGKEVAVQNPGSTTTQPAETPVEGTAETQGTQAGEGTTYVHGSSSETQTVPQDDVTNDYSFGTHTQENPGGGFTTVTNEPRTAPPPGDTMSPGRQDSFHQQSDMPGEDATHMGPSDSSSYEGT